MSDPATHDELLNEAGRRAARLLELLGIATPPAGVLRGVRADQLERGAALRQRLNEAAGALARAIDAATEERSEAYERSNRQHGKPA